MTLSAGAQLGPYEILSPLGAGGMGEVYRARDRRLGREVAIKVLPAAVSSDAERLRRFEREAQAASSLNHPNIVTIYDIGSEGSVSYIAMELVEGHSLRELMEGPLKVRQLLEIAVQMAEGLAKAHAAGIVHRDLKPENVMMTGDGHIKILDFGLAKLTQPDSSQSAATAPAETTPGTVMGTIGYMSPEQAMGKVVDFRSDQFSFGSILYEMATGRRPFQRSSAPQTMAAIIQDEPDPIQTANPQIPAPVRWLVQRCLAKDVRGRYASTEDLARELATVREHLSEATSAIDAVAAAREPVRRRGLWIVAAIAATVLLAGGVMAWRLRRADYFWKNPLAGAHFTRLTDWESSELDAAISADGKFVAFVSDREGGFDVWVGQVGGGEFLNLTKGRFPVVGHEFIRSEGFSGDGAQVWLRIGVKSAKEHNVWLVPTMGGVPHPFLQNAVEAVWSPDRSHVLYYTFVPGDPMFIADRNGGNPKQIFISKPGIHNHYPAWSPDGRFVYFVRGIPSVDMAADIWRVPSAGGPAEQLTQHHARVAYPTLLDDRTLIYSAAGEDGSGSRLYAMDVERRIPHPVTSGLEEYLSVAASADGRRLVATVANPVHNLWTVPISDQMLDDSDAVRLSLPTVRATAPRFGPDYLLYLSSRGGADGLWKFQDGVETELWKGSEGPVTAAPAISPDGTEICFSVRREGRAHLYRIASDGTNAHPIAESLDVRNAPSWSRDGKWIAIVNNEGKMNPLLRVPVDGGPPVRLVDGMEGVIFNPVWSPDGRLIVYTQTQGSAKGMLRGVTPDQQPVPLPEVSVLNWGDRYRFLPDGKALVVIQGEMWHQNFWFVDLGTGRRRQLTNFRPGFDVKSFDVSPDGKRIVF
ncbi:MAG: protein kinase, partial [Acidobacteriota bacterium]